MNKLPIPEGIEGDDNAQEMIRVWIGNKDIHVSMLLGMWEEAANFDIDEREAWGELLGDLIRHIANGLTQSHDYNVHASERRIANALLTHLGYGANTITGTIENAPESPADED
ncbi:MAG: DUF5076 domain-containing protein [Desulfobacterales bacterium]|nr:DUF5076 domain-containing protein [Desulfobacterales bacterium]